MAKKTHGQKEFERKEDAEARLLHLVKQVPAEVFVAMVSRSGIPSKEAREMCLAFKALKD